MLARHGYRLRFREHEWVECLIASEADAFEGRGMDRAAALESALRRAFPSRVARELLEMAVSGVSVATESELTDEMEGISAQLSAFRDRTAQMGIRRVETPPPLFGATGEGSVASRLSSPAPGRTAPMLVRSQASRPNADEQRSLEDLQILTDRIEESRHELAWSTAPRQRLAILAWICEARSHTDIFPEHPDIREAVARVSRQLTEIGKAFWPGSVTALQLQMQPSDLPRHLLGGSPSTWARAAELAERALAHLELVDERRGQDPYGWGDAWALSPEPEGPSLFLSGLVNAVEEAWGPLDRFAEPRNPEDLPEPRLYARWVRELRWIRGQDVDPDLWARVMGRLRWWACRRNGPVHAEGRELEPGFRPERSWAEVLQVPGIARSDGQLPEGLVEEVRGRFQGKRLLWVGRRRDPVEQARLTEALPDTELEWRFAEPSLIEALPASLEQGGYAAVVSAVGLQAQIVDLALARSCKTVGIRYVRANRGQPLACLRGLARSYV